MHRRDSTPAKTGGLGTTLLLWLLCALLILAVFAVAVDSLVPKIESDLRSRSALALSGTGITAQNIEADGMDIILTGDIDSAPLRDEAGKIVASVHGVRQVRNSLNLDTGTSPDTSPSAATTQQSDLTDSPTPSTTPALPNSANLDVSITDDQITLRGTLASENDVSRIVNTLEGKYGAGKIDNQMQIDSAASPVWLDNAIAAIDQFDNIQNPALLISNGKARLSGDVSSETLGAQKIALVQRLFGDDIEVQSSMAIRQQSPNSTLTGKPSTKSNKRPGSLKLANEGGRQKLSGVVSSQEELGEIIKAAQDIYKPSALEIAIKVDESVQPIQWADKMFSAANDLKDIDNLGLSVNSGQLVLSGNVESRDIAEAAKASVREKMDGSLDVIDTFSVPSGLAAEDRIASTDSGATVLAQSPETIATPTPQAVLSNGDDEEEQTRQLGIRLRALDLSQIRFERSSSQLTDDAKSTLDSVANAILDYAKPAVEIAGHTDSVGDAFTNLELSKQRADAVRQYLIAQSVPAAQIRAIGYGETKPVGDNGTPAGRATNRRIEINL